MSKCNTIYFANMKLDSSGIAIRDRYQEEAGHKGERCNV